MTMKLEDSLRWQAESAAVYIERLRESLGDSVNDNILDVMAKLYREGWSDCFKLARLHGVERI